MKSKKDPDGLDIRLETYAGSDMYPFHMPGHKRNIEFMANPYALDITEIDGFDDLHAPNGILKEAMERASRLYGAKRSFYLVNGSTCGILAAISASVPFGGKLLMARNAHKSVYHAAYLRHLSTEYLNPPLNGLGMHGAVDPGEVRQMLEKNSGIHAVLITSPTYEGVVSDVMSIAKIAHEYHVPLIVDEAHGAHFGFHPAFPQTAVRLGADLVIQSMHKTLPSLTQTALLHLNSVYVKEKDVQRYLSIYETSSPSYLLMAAMDRCVRLLKEDGGRLFERHAARLDEFYKKAETFSHIQILRKADFAGAYDVDMSKIIIASNRAGIDGQSLYGLLRDDYHLQMEMFSRSYVLAMTSIMDDGGGMDRLFAALDEINALGFSQEKGFFEDFELVSRFYAPKEKKMEIFEAMDGFKKTVSFDEAAGRISGGMACLYPPGIPALLPGETIDEGFVKTVRECIKYRLNLHGIADIINERMTVVA